MAREIGPAVFDLLLPQLRGAASGEEPGRVWLKPTLVIRESTVKDAGLGQDPGRS